MCNLNVLFRTTKAKDIKPFLMGVTARSYTSNSHGEGFFCDNQVIKQKEKINLYDYSKAIDKSLRFISHQRYSTSGFKVKFNHPFISKRWVLIHNGVINQFQEHKEESDTAGFFRKFNREFDRYKKLNPSLSDEKVLSLTIDELFKGDDGSYSIFILDRKTNLGYYFKDSTTRINFYQNKENLYITTESDNAKLLNLLDNKKFIELDIEPRVIYRIDGTMVYIVEKMREVKKAVTWEYNHNTTTENKKDWNKSYWENWNKHNTTTQTTITNDTNSLKDYFVIDNKGFLEPYFCSICFNEIHHKVYTTNNKDFLCKKCLKLELSEQKTEPIINNSYTSSYC